MMLLLGFIPIQLAIYGIYRLCVRVSKSFRK